MSRIFVAALGGALVIGAATSAIAENTSEDSRYPLFNAYNYLARGKVFESYTSLPGMPGKDATKGREAFGSATAPHVRGVQPQRPERRGIESYTFPRVDIQ